MISTALRSPLTYVVPHLADEENQAPRLGDGEGRVVGSGSEHRALSALHCCPFPNPRRS